MKNIAMEPLNGWKFGFATGTVRPLRLNLAERYRRWRKHWSVLSELRQFSDDQLAELGICASDISHTAMDEATRS